MKKVLILFVLCLSFLLSDNTCNQAVLKAGIGSSDVGFAFVGVLFVLLARGGSKK